MAINRNTVSKLGEYGYAPPTDAIGLNGIFPQWVTDPAIKAQAKALATYNPTAAKKLLTDNGFTYKGSKLIDPKGNPVSLDIHVISGWSDWVASTADHHEEPAGDRHRRERRSSSRTGTPGTRTRSRTKTPTLLWQNASQGSPYGFFYANLLQNALSPRARTAPPTGNWEHFAERQRDGPPQPVEDVARPGRSSTRSRRSSRQLWLDRHAGRPALHRAALVDLQHEVLPLLHVAEELLRRPDLHARSPTTSSRSPASAPAAQAGA